MRWSWLILALTSGCWRSVTALWVENHAPASAAWPADVWIDLTPEDSRPDTWLGFGPGCDQDGHVCTDGTGALAFDPSDADVLYLNIDALGLWRTADGGASWRRLGDPEAEVDIYDDTSTYIGSPGAVAVDPNDPLHLYAIEGDHGLGSGFWVSHDGGDNWARPAGFRAAARTELGWYVSGMAVDPDDFRHILIAGYNDWGVTVGDSSGVAESFDGGDTWTHRVPASEPWSNARKSIHFLYAPEIGVGDTRRWLLCDGAGGFWRTIDGGASWVQVAATAIPVATNELYYTAGGVLYAGGFPWPMRSNDNGASWSALDMLTQSSYFSLAGDGERLYAHVQAWESPQPFYVSAETDGSNWVQDPAPGVLAGFPLALRFDRRTRVLYASNALGGLWGMRVSEP